MGITTEQFRARIGAEDNFVKPKYSYTYRIYRQHAENIRLLKKKFKKSSVV